MTSTRYFLAAFGCQMNRLDGELLEGDLRRRGWIPAPSENGADVVLYLTCSVRERPEEKVFSRIAQIPRSGGRPLVCVAGCMAQRLGAGILDRAPGVDLVVGPSALDACGPALERLLAGETGPRLLLDRNDAVPAREPAARIRPFQAFVAAARGCSNRCAYCVVPEARGPARSRPLPEIVAEAAELLEAGVLEITLLAQSVSGYGRDLDPPAGLADLLEAVHALPGLVRLRFLTSHPADLDQRTLEAMRDLPRLCPHLHMPAQSGSDRVLAAMNRGYTRRDYLERVARARALVPGVEFTSDFIVGFPGETLEDFEATVSLVETVGFQNIFVFQYSPRPKTAAFDRADDVASEEKRRRNHVLLDVQERIAARDQAAWIGREAEILVEGPSKRDPTRLTGRTAGNRIVVFPASGAGRAGRLVRVRVTAATPLTLVGETPGGGAS